MIKLQQVLFEQPRKITHPVAKHVKYCVRGEDFDTDYLFFRRKTPLSEAGPTFHRHFKPGEILYMTRNPRLRKVAQPDFEGVAANTTLVLDEEVNAILIPGIVKYILSSDKFHEYAKSVQVGSTNPFTKWKDLKEFEFSPPSQKRQKELLKLLEKIEQNLKYLESYTESLFNLERIISYDFFKSYSTGYSPIDTIMESQPESGYSPNEHWEDTGKYVLNLSCLSKSGFTKSRLKPVVDKDFVKNLVLSKGDFLISRANTFDLVGLCGIFNEQREDVIFPDTMWRLKFKPDVNKELVLNYLLSPQGRCSIQRLAAGTSGSMKKINKKGFSSIKIPIIEKNEGCKYCSVVRNIRLAFDESCLKKENLIQIRKNITEELVG
ncbi:hypothetical protein AC791_17575 [Klebsiella sp. RIT-PI-d]|uniref:restriction endonuclease subunit S n=1 Tax=Klebsiella sp. RIT-PI-d TaxID=1681196 RepID=UPI000676825C|nr:restriction endonuclease subunit S [Klebsiella sp. RIT-PI-d]KNC06407.1 hypothetical protein AC791_17575 [Klebsiella sp. RIT-PI-d]